MAQGPVCCRAVLSEPGVWLREQSKRGRDAGFTEGNSSASSGLSVVINGVPVCVVVDAFACPSSHIVLSRMRGEAINNVLNR